MKKRLGLTHLIDRNEYTMQLFKKNNNNQFGGIISPNTRMFSVLNNCKFNIFLCGFWAWEKTFKVVTLDCKTERHFFSLF